MYIVKTKDPATARMDEKSFRTRHGALAYMMLRLEEQKLEPVSLELPNGTVLPKAKLVEMASIHQSGRFFVPIGHAARGRWPRLPVAGKS